MPLHSPALLSKLGTIPLHEAEPAFSSGQALPRASLVGPSSAEVASGVYSRYSIPAAPSSRALARRPASLRKRRFHLCTPFAIVRVTCIEVLQTAGTGIHYSNSPLP